TARLVATSRWPRSHGLPARGVKIGDQARRAPRSIILYLDVLRRIPHDGANGVVLADAPLGAITQRDQLAVIFHFDNVENHGNRGLARVKPCRWREPPAGQGAGEALE